MTADDALRAIQALARANRIHITTHAAERMAERRITRRDIWYVLTTAGASCTASTDRPGRWRVVGADADGVETGVVAVIRDGVVVVTIF